MYPLEDGAVAASDALDGYVSATGPDTDQLHAWWTDVSATLVEMYEVTDTDIVEIWRSGETATHGTGTYGL